MTRFAFGRRVWPALALLALTIVATVPSIERTRGAPAVPSSWTVVGTHPGASQQPSETGRTLWSLAVWDGRIYPGYGDWAGNFGPILIASFDPATGEFVEEWTSGVQNIWNFRPLLGRFYALAGDPRGPTTFAVRDESSAWRDVEIGPVTHALDMTALGNELWLSGTLSYDGYVWRDGEGSVWTPALRFDPNTTGAALNAMFFIFAFDGDLYVQNTDWSNPTAPASRVWDGEAWRDGPNLLPDGGTGWRPFAVDGAVVYLDRLPAHHGPAQLLRFNGNEATVLLPDETFYDLAVAGDDIYALATSGLILRGAAADSWETIAGAPADARSLAVLDDRLYVGTTGAKLLVLDESLAMHRASRTNRR